MKHDDLTSEFQNRRDRLRLEMIKLGYDACLISMDVNLYYTTGKVFNGYAYLDSRGDVFYFVKRPSNFLDIGVVSIYKPENIAEFFEVNRIGFPSNLLLETDEISYNDCLRLLKVFKQPKIGNATSLLRQIREIKSDWEIEQFRISAINHAATYEKITSCFHMGMTDIELQLEIEKIMRLNGSVGIFHTFGPNMNLFMGSVLAGSNAEIPSPFDFALGGEGSTPLCPIGANGTVLKDGMSIMVDMAGNYTPYMTDMTRVFSVGKLPDLAYRAHLVALNIQNEIEQIVKPGFPCNKIYEIAATIAKNEGLSDYFMGTIQQAKFVGHGVGLQINEPPVFTPRSQELIMKNMVFALEPKFVIPNVGAVGIENTFLVTENGLEKLTQFEEQIIPIY